MLFCGYSDNIQFFLCNWQLIIALLNASRKVSNLCEIISKYLILPINLALGFFNHNACALCLLSHSVCRIFLCLNRTYQTQHITWTVLEEDQMFEFLLFCPFNRLLQCGLHLLQCGHRHRHVCCIQTARATWTAFLSLADWRICCSNRRGGAVVTRRSLDNSLLDERFDLQNVAVQGIAVRRFAQRCQKQPVLLFFCLRWNDFFSSFLDNTNGICCRVRRGACWRCSIVNFLNIVAER